MADMMKINPHRGGRFSQVPDAYLPRSAFNRSHGLKTTFDAGFLVPIYVDEALPGDTFQMRMTAFGRLATPLFPLMDNLWLSTFFFAVPIRLIWDNWERMNGAQDDPADSIDFLVPEMAAPAATGHLNGSLSDYLGIPTEVPDFTHSSLWHRAYNLIWNTWFRDQNLQDSVVVDKDDGPDLATDYVLLRRGKRHDYFTSALPWPQKGDSVDLPLGISAPVDFAELGATPQALTLAREAATANLALNIVEGGGTAGATVEATADLSTATAASINQLRQAFAIQRLIERDARGGTRYIEIVRSHFGVVSPDARLQRPEYLGGGRSPIHINPVAQTSEAGTTPQANLAAFGTVVAEHGFVRSFTEHCVLIGLASVQADLTYQQGLDRMFARRSRYDFYWPDLAHIGEQTILNQEIYLVDPAGAGAAQNAAAFGYQERFGEYRYKPSRITGQFRSNFATSLDGWHLAQDFAALPVLDATFIADTPPVDRVIATASYPHLIMDAGFDLRCARRMPMYGVPTGLGRF